MDQLRIRIMAADFSDSELFTLKSCKIVFVYFKNGGPGQTNCPALGFSLYY